MKAAQDDIAAKGDETLLALLPAWKPSEAQAAQSSLSCTWLGAKANVGEWAEIAAMQNILHKRVQESILAMHSLTCFD